MDPELTGWFSLRDFDSHIFDIVREFKRWTKENYDTIPGIFSAIDDDGNGRLSWQELSGAVGGVVPDLATLFHGLDPKGRGIWFEQDVVFVDEWDLDWEQEPEEPEEEEEADVIEEPPPPPENQKFF